ncbi:MAG TPA: Na+/H+ antiporter NhaC family protein, partial [Bacteroidales bacterium]|nr:Na+/H+ antiporter NhaC family protein [Bacteroidales bacterium]
MSTAIILVLVIVSIAAVIWLTSRLRINAFIALFLISFLLAAAVIPVQKVVSTLKDGFGSTMASIGFLIIFGAMIGVILDKTGATLSIADFILSKTGRKKSAAALGITGYITGLPIFCDSAFIVL